MTQHHPTTTPLHRELDRVRLARQRRRRAAGAGLCLTLLLGTTWLAIITLRPHPPAQPTIIAHTDQTANNSPTPPTSTHDAPATTATTPPPDPAPGPRVIRIAGTNHTIPRFHNQPIDSRVITTAAPTRVVRISDAELIAAFDALGEPVGIVRMEGITTLARLHPREETRMP